MPVLQQAGTFIHEVIRMMCVTHVEVVGLCDEYGSIVRVISFGDIAKAFVKELKQISQSSSKSEAPIQNEAVGKESRRRHRLHGYPKPHCLKPTTDLNPHTSSLKTNY